MRWTKKGLIFAPDHTYPWMVSHASLPVPDLIDDDVLRIYFGTRDAHGRSHVGVLEVDANAPERILRVHDRPVLPLGDRGTFDDSGIMPSWLVTDEGTKYLYYIGWNPQVTVSYRLAIGLAVSSDGGATFEKVSAGPICDRSSTEPFFTTAPCVIRDDTMWRMWYVSCTGWTIRKGWPEPQYHIKYAESTDGIRWRMDGVICIDHAHPTEAIGRPCVFKSGGRYEMIFSYRDLDDYRTQPSSSYRLGYAESADGLSWSRADDQVGIARSPDGWDSQMMEYCYLLRSPIDMLFYHGNGFGLTGFGYAVRTEDPPAAAHQART